MKWMTRRLAVAMGLSCPFSAFSTDTQADRIVVNKARRELILLRNGQTLKTYQVALGKHPVGPKIQEGDMRTPEGLYRTMAGMPRASFTGPFTSRIRTRRTGNGRAASE